VCDALPEAAPGGGLTDTPLLIGVGHDGRCDDAAGVRAARLVRALLWPRARVIECAGGATALLEAWQGEPEVVVVDAMCSGSPIGTVRRMDASREPLNAELFRGSTHGLGLAEAVELARSLGRLPSSLVVFGIEGIDFGIGTRLSFPVECAVREAALLISEELLADRN
jgi:hydrogenase maturation protease